MNEHQILAPVEASEDVEIPKLAARFAALQKTLNLGDRAFVGRYKELGSEKSWNLIKDGSWRGALKQDSVLKRLYAMRNRIEASSSFDADEYVELPVVKVFNWEFNRLLQAQKDRRGLIILASEGVGKTWWASRIVEEDPARRFYVHLNATWKDKSMHLLRGIAERIGASLENNPASQQRAVIQKLNELKDPVLLIDEGHNGGITIWRILKDIIATTETRVVLMAFPTQFDQVRMASTSAVAEAKQFLRRCQRPIVEDYRNGVRTADVIEFLVKACRFPKGADVNALAEQITPTVSRGGNISLLADALDEARAEADRRGETMTLELFATALRGLCGVAQKKEGGAK